MGRTASSTPVLAYSTWPYRLRFFLALAICAGEVIASLGLDNHHIRMCTAEDHLRKHSRGVRLLLYIIEGSSIRSKFCVYFLCPPIHTTAHELGLLIQYVPHGHHNVSVILLWLKQRTTHFFKYSSNHAQACKKALSFAYFCCWTLMSQRTAKPCSTPL